MNHSNKPLTLEELRNMDGQPVWGVSLASGKPGEWFIVRVVEMSKCWFIACAGASQGFGDKDTYGKTWLAYAQKPIDFDAWKGCDFCHKELDDYPYIAARGDFCESDTCYEPSYCPICGRPLTKSARELLEKRLRGE